MLQSIGDVREGFICPQCHQDMSTMEMLHVHFEDVHMKQPSSTVKGFFSLAKQKIKSVQDNFTTNSIEQSNLYASCFSFDLNDPFLAQQQQQKHSSGFDRSHTDKFKKLRKEKRDQISIDTTRLLLRLEQLISTDEHVPRNTNTKERRKYEQDIVEWIDESKVTLCPSCAKTFGLSRRKHHCRLDGFVICNQCSQFLPFSTARYLIEPTSSASSSSKSTNGVTLQRSNSLTSLTSAMTVDESVPSTSNEDYLRICLSCRQVLQKRYDQIRFKISDKDEFWLLYEKIVEAKRELTSIQPTYSAMIESLLSGDTKHQLIEAQRLYRRLSVCYEKIDSTSKQIALLADSCPNIDENDIASQIRHAALCRNIRMYAVQLLQNYAISTRKVPSDEDVKQAREERQRTLDERNELERLTKAELALRLPSTGSTSSPKKAVAGWRPTIDRGLLERTQELEPLVQQIYQVTQFIRQAQIAGREDEVKLLQLNLKELEQAMNNAQQQEQASSTIS